MRTKNKTLILDIDGTLVKHWGSYEGPVKEAELLPGVLTKFAEWDSAGYNIILMTGRRESLREKTVKQLQNLGLNWDTLIMGVGGGPRILINDLKPDPKYGPTAIAIQVERNKGLESVKI